MKIEVTYDELRKRKLMVASPLYGGMANGNYTLSMIRLADECRRIGVIMEPRFILNESLISRARNYLVDDFMRNEEFTHFMFIDADIDFNAKDVIELLAISDPASDYKVLTGAYPKKNISWEKVVNAVNKGLADESPNNLENYVGDYVVNFLKDGQISLGDPVEVRENGTGFMMIQRSVFEQFNQKYPEMRYNPDHVRTKEFNGEREITAFFMDYIDKEENRHLSEDYMFCKYARNMGEKIWFCPWINLNHIGTYAFKGNFPLMASANMNHTIDKGFKYD